MAKRRRLTLATRMLILVFLPLWALSGASIGIGTYYMAEQQTRKLKDDIKLIARAIRVPIGEAIDKGDLTTVQRTLDAVFSIGQVYGASVYNKNGERIAAAGIARHDQEDNPLAEKMLKGGEDGDAYQHQAGRRVYSHFVPVNDGGAQLPIMIEVTRRASDFSTSVDRLAYWAWGSWGLVGFITLIIVLLGYRQAAGREVAQLTRVMGDVGRGQLKSRAKVRGATELAGIGEALNQMLDEIEAAQAAIEAHQAHEISLNQRLERQERMAALGRLVSGIAHELGAPLNVIDGRARRLAKLDDDPKGARELAAIRGQVARLTRIVRQLLDFSRSGVQWQTVTLQALVANALESVGYEQQDTAPIYAIDIPESLKVCVDPARLELALVNILRNATQAAHSKVGVSARAIPETSQWELDIWDDGDGIDSQLEAEQLLEPFFTTKPKGEGTGLGLAIVQNVVHDHGGHVTLRPSREGGLHVSLLFPEENPS
ncbi:sensor histidine kinase [Vibrio palustris]|uniref:histidine kinase n=1 Tax=Vibrio palustris TaxID=1918946 RepID=A0A1R4B695_9VIBR|nr:ATP-binding protein [Vibrio palustris]SJL84445.1 Sensor protein ZraS [Vibrio palustris]